MFNQPVTIIILNDGRIPIIFSNDFEIQLFVFENNDWENCEYFETKYVEGDILLRPTDNNPLLFGTTMIEPIVKNQISPQKFRIVIMGYQYVDEMKTNQQVAAYTDIWLYPEE